MHPCSLVAALSFGALSFSAGVMEYVFRGRFHPEYWVEISLFLKDRLRYLVHFLGRKLLFALADHGVLSLGLSR